MLLKVWGYECRAVYDGVAGLRAACDYCPNCLVLDLCMPGLDGYALARRVRAQPSLDQSEAHRPHGLFRRDERPSLTRGRVRLPSRKADRTLGNQEAHGLAQRDGQTRGQLRTYHKLKRAKQRSSSTTPESVRGLPSPKDPAPDTISDGSWHGAKMPRRHHSTPMTKGADRPCTSCSCIGWGWVQLWDARSTRGC